MVMKKSCHLRLVRFFLIILKFYSQMQLNRYRWQLATKFLDCYEKYHFRVLVGRRERRLLDEWKWALVSGLGNRAKWPVDRDEIKHREKLHLTVLTQIVPAAGQQAHPKTASYSVPLNASTLGAGFATNEYSHLRTGRWTINFSHHREARNPHRLGISFRLTWSSVSSCT